MLASAFAPNGLIATPTRERVAAYQAVIGAYLSTFQLLGGLGLLLGVLGLAVVVLRGVWERLGELALLRAVGYRTATAAVPRAGRKRAPARGRARDRRARGARSRSLRTLPRVRPCRGLASRACSALVLVVGLGVASAATAGILRVPVIPALRRE